MDVFPGISEPIFRLSAFISILVVLAACELWAPRRKLVASKARRWLTNISIVALGSLVVRAMGALAVPLVAVAAAIFAASHGWGILNMVALPGWLEIVIALLVLDLAIWFQHLMSHKIPVFWRLHRMHHADRDIDVTTALRFHPIEIGLSMLWKIVCVLALGAAPLAVILFEVILNGCAMFNHANLRLPASVDGFLRLFLVTPDMHRVHHSVLNREHDSNYGFNLSIWDRLFGTYVPQPKGGHEGMTIGVSQYQTEDPTRLWWSLRLPWKPLARRHEPPKDQPNPNVKRV
ncbi:Sterol desaturase-like protein [Candidatus Filomicrobium marinum]|uniref:Sterol desaturase-like protein n=1 Tax=Candidatus Filomicrobium marinum TaxID=1608628 RepID=A0A0D6JEB9_9HYPH|nr:sterol desaturase family protein [Candidatus Filomicrobium marinum]CFX20433.1 Sterol desaturase-like protein [Candidatus Filomicrobium marinum]CPR18652.1 Sterol desaturase-like protein [Candidatus Filomicrobium marinum]